MGEDDWLEAAYEERYDTFGNADWSEYMDDDETDHGVRGPLYDDDDDSEDVMESVWLADVGHAPPPSDVHTR